MWAVKFTNQLAALCVGCGKTRGAEDLIIYCTARLVTVPAVHYYRLPSLMAFTEFNKASRAPTARVDVISPHVCWFARTQHTHPSILSLPLCEQQGTGTSECSCTCARYIFCLLLPDTGTMICFLVDQASMQRKIVAAQIPGYVPGTWKYRQAKRLSKARDGRIDQAESHS